MGVHNKSDKKLRKEKYTKQFSRTEKNKNKFKELMKKLNPNWPNKKEKK